MNADASVRFDGPVECRIDRTGPLGLTLMGPQGADTLRVSFVGVAPADFPARLEAALVERAGEGEYRIVSGSDRRVVRARRVFVHRDVGKVFCGAVPARPPPLAKRLLWRVVLAFAGSALGRRMLGGPRSAAP